MLLSMNMLLDELKQFDLSSHIEDGNCTIAGVRLFPSVEYCTQENIYIGITYDFFGNDSSSVIIAHRRDYIIIRSVLLFEVFNYVLRIFEKYNYWDKLLNGSTNEQNFPQNLLEIANSLLHFPMILVRNDMKIYAITRNYSSKDVFEEFDECKYTSSLHSCVIKRMKPSKRTLYDTCSLDTILFESNSDGNKDNYKFSVRINVLFRNNIWGYLYLFLDQPLRVSDYQLAKHVVRFFEKNIINLTNTDSIENNQFSYFADLIDGTVIHKSMVLDIYTSLHWNMNDTLKIYKIITLPNAPEFVLCRWIYNKLSQEFENTPVFFYDNSIIVIWNQTQNKAERLEASIEDILSLGNINCGSSFPFCGITHLKSYYKQASFSSEIFANYDYKIRHFGNHAYWCMIKLFRENLFWVDWIHPNIFKLMEVDRVQGTEYFQTLSIYLKSQCNSKLTANAMYLHPNTVTYRLSKIQGVLELNFNDNDVIDYLRLCIGLMEHTDFENPLSIF